MNGWARFILLCAFCGCSILSATAESSRPPYEAIRDLRRLEDRIVAGDTVAEAAHAKAIERTARDFTRAPKSTWMDPRNTRALIIYLFSGGDAAEIESAISASDVPAEMRSLYSGALAYGIGDDAEARKLLLPIDPRTMPSSLGGHLALVEATLSAQESPAKAIDLLDLSRLPEPGTLVEEAALRKEMSLIGGTGDINKFALLSRRYLAVFPKSIYADNFRQLVAMTAVQIGNGDSAEAIDRLNTLMSGIDKDQQRRLYLTIARHAVIAGRVRMATRASEEAGRLSQGSRRDEARAMTYYGAATVVGDHFDLGVKALTAVEPAQLESRDRDLRASALAVADMIRSTPKSNMPVDPSGDTQAATLAEAERSMAAADALLKDPSP